MSQSLHHDRGHHLLSIAQLAYKTAFILNKNHYLHRIPILEAFTAPPSDWVFIEENQDLPWEYDFHYFLIDYYTSEEDELDSQQQFNWHGYMKPRY